MTPVIRALALLASTFALTAAGCGGPPKQAEVPDVDKGTGEDIAPTEGAPGAATEGAPTESAPAGEEEMHTKCCAECKTGLSKDRSGAAPDTIPCADFTDTLSPWCLEHFRSKPVMAASCQ